jgi:hypothetical protein
LAFGGRREFDACRPGYICDERRLGVAASQPTAAAAFRKRRKIAKPWAFTTADLSTFELATKVSQRFMEGIWQELKDGY